MADSVNGNMYLNIITSNLMNTACNNYVTSTRKREYKKGEASIDAIIDRDSRTEQPYSRDFYFATGKRCAFALYLLYYWLAFT